jgi:predicted Rossmann fold nucleotide-binding protein DprA/Smf involved in DNA uptake
LTRIGPGELLTIDEIARRAATDVAVISAELVALELDGRVRRDADGRYSRVRGARPPE